MLDEDESGSDDTDSQAVRTARMLGYAGLIPFVCLSLWLYAIAPDHEWHDGTILLLLAYGAVVLSFLGGVRWGLALNRGDEGGALEYGLSVVPSLIGWLSVAMPVPYAFGVLAVAFAAHGAWDALAVHAERAPAWYGNLRSILTAAVVVTMFVAFIATG